MHIINAGIVQWLVCKFSKLEMRVRFSLPAPGIKEDKGLPLSYFIPPVRESAKRLPAPGKVKSINAYFLLYEDMMVILLTFMIKCVIM